MRIGVALPSKDLDMDQTWLVLEHAEQSGYAHIWLGDGVDAAGPAPLITLTFLTARSQRLRLGTPMLPDRYRQQAPMARELAALGSKGRLILTLAPGTTAPDSAGEVWISTGDQADLVPEALATFAQSGDGIIASDLGPDACAALRRQAETALLSSQRNLGDFPLALRVTVPPEGNAPLMSRLARYALAGVTDLVVRFQSDDQIGRLRRFTEDVKPHLELGDLVAAIEARAAEPGWGDSPEGLMYLQSIALALVPQTGLDLDAARANARIFLENFPPMSLPFGDVDQRAARWLAQLLDEGGSRSDLRRSIAALAEAWQPIASVAAEQLGKWSAGEAPADPREDSPWFQALVALARTELQT